MVALIPRRLREGAAPAPATATTATAVTSPRGTLNSLSNGSQPSPVRPILKVNGSPSPGRKGTVRFAEAVDAVSPPPEFELTAEEKEQQQQQQQQPREQQHQFSGPQSTPTLPLLRLPRAMEKEEDDGGTLILLFVYFAVLSLCAVADFMSVSLELTLPLSARVRCPC